MKKKLKFPTSSTFWFVLLRHSPHVATGALNVATGSCLEKDL
jgi:hypothetical protein